MRSRCAFRYAAMACVALLPLITSACDDDDSPTSPDEEALARLRDVTDAFHDVQAAKDAGYTVLVTHPTTGARCLSDPQLGGMGFHYLDAALADGTVAIESPEAIIYEPRADGSLELVGVEYLVPFAVRPETATPPELFGRPFMQNETFQVWALHAWAWKDNPSGTFEPYNPDVSCQYSDEVP